MAIERFTPDHPLWAGFCTHLRQHDMAQWVLQPGQISADTPCQPLPALYFLVAVERDQVVGHITLKMQRVEFPSANGDDASSTAVLMRDERPLRELFVQTFAVNQEFRNQGRGRMLQSSALDLCRRLGCYQLRSWSSADKVANYALKLRLGFSIHPALLETPEGKQVAGAYFVKTVMNF